LLPLHPKAFGDYPAGLYFYLVSISEFFFGLNEFSVRLPAALIGAFTVIPFFFLVKEIFRKVNLNKYFVISDYLSLVAVFILALSTWHIVQSRASSESVLAFFLLSVLAFFVLSFLKPGKENF